MNKSRAGFENARDAAISEGHDSFEHEGKRYVIVTEALGDRLASRLSGLKGAISGAKDAVVGKARGAIGGFKGDAAAVKAGASQVAQGRIKKDLAKIDTFSRRVIKNMDALIEDITDDIGSLGIDWKKENKDNFSDSLKRAYVDGFRNQVWKLFQKVQSEIISSAKKKPASKKKVAAKSA